MTEYNNTSSYPDSVRAARITVGDIPKNYCDYLYQRDVKGRTGAGFCVVEEYNLLLLYLHEHLGYKSTNICWNSCVFHPPSRLRPRAGCFT